MDSREQKGLQIAATVKISKVTKGWLVPSQSSKSEKYLVNVDEQTCDCPDNTFRRQKCKHIYAVEYTLERETVTDGETTVTTTTETVKVSRKTYAQDWTAYNAAQVEEKDRFMELLADLCKGIRQPEQSNGRPKLPLSDMVFASAFKVYSLFSSRRFTSDLNEARKRGYINSTPHFNSVSRYLSDLDLTPIFMDLVAKSSLPLSKVEHSFAGDSSGFSTSRFVRWFNKKWGKEADNREWVKCHLMCGVKTNIVTAVEISGWTAHDTNFFEPLFERTAKSFELDEVSLDKAYLSHKNMDLAALAGVTPYIPFKSNTVPVEVDGFIWSKMYHMFMFNREEWLNHYHMRSNVETTFSMIKGKFGDSVKSKSEIGQINEVLCKVICHNICVLIQETRELGIEPTFGAEMSVAPKAA
jgi:transposase